MEPITTTIALGLFAMGSGMGWWLARSDSKMNSLGIQMILMQESQSSALAITSKRIEDLENSISSLVSGIGAIRAANPELDGLILAHEALQGKGDLTEALKIIVSKIPDTADQDSLTLLSPGEIRLAESLLEAITEIETLPAPLARKIGLVALASGRTGRARTMMEKSYESAPGDDTTLRILEHIATLTGDIDARRHWIEARLALSPDNPELLRSHAHLLVAQGDQEAERDVLRLEALGLDTPADRSLLSGLRERAGSRSEALEAIDRALAEDPTRAKDWYQRAELLLAEKEPVKALESVDRCIELERQNGDAWALRAKLLADSPRVNEACKAATHAVALGAGGVELVILKADLLLAMDEFGQSEKTLEKALEEYSDNGEMRAAIANRRLSENRHTEAWDILQSTPQGCTHPLLHVVEGRLHLALADRQRDGTGEKDIVLLTDAENAFNAALELDREQGIAWLGIARTRRLLSRIELAEEALTRATRLLPDEDPSVSAESALLALDNNDIDSAKQHVDAASIRGGGSVVSYIRGNIATRIGNLKSAKAHYDDALSQDSSHVKSRLNRCSVNMALDNAKAALDDANVLLEIAPDMMLSKLKRAEALMMLGDWADAKADLEEIIEKSPTQYQAMTQLAGCFIALGRPEQAESPLNEALMLNQDHAPAWFQRGLLYLDWGKEEAAINDLVTATKVDPTHLDAHLHLAAIHHEAERFDQASTAWRAVLAIDGEHAVAKKRLEESESAILTHI